MAKKPTYEFIKEQFKLRDYELLEIEYINTSTPMKYRCPHHPEKKLQIVWSSFKSGNGCKYCGWEKIKKPYLYNINDIIETNTGNIEILEQFRKVRKDNKNDKTYKCKCLVCGYEDYKYESGLKNNSGCAACTGSKLCVGYNDIHTVNPKLEKLLLNKEDAYKYTQCSKKRTDWVCSNCENIIYDKAIKNINDYGVACNICGNNHGGSFPERFLGNVLKDLKLKIKTQKTFKWSNKKKYDCYLIHHNIIIEIHGKQHTSENGFLSCRNGKALEEEQANDKYKYEIAINNGIDKYIVIDAKESDFQYIKNEILNSELNVLFDFSSVDWDKCYENSLTSIVVESWKLWNSGKTVKEISKILDKSTATINTYLTNGFKINKCTYNSILENPNNGRYVVCLTTKEIFKTLKIAGEKYNIAYNGISICCSKTRTKTCGKHPLTKEKLKWEYYNLEIHTIQNGYDFCE